MVRLTRAAARLAQRMPIAPFIIKARRDRLSEVVAYISENMPRIDTARLVPIIDALAGFERSLAPSPRIMDRIGMISCVLTRDLVYDLAQHRDVEKIYPDSQKWALSFPTVPPEGRFRITVKGKELLFTTTYWTKKAIGADKAGAAGFDGSGVRVAVLDTGVVMTHDQLRLKAVERHAARAFWTANDQHGHGTWVCTCIGGRRSVDYNATRMIGRDVICEGMAPGCHVISIKVLDYVIGTGMDSDVLYGLNKCIELGVDVINMSLGGPIEADVQEDDPYYDVISQLTANGTIVCVAAGNEGPDSGTISSPGWIEDALTVGAYDPITGDVATYSSRGPTPDGRTKPDITMPGGGLERPINSGSTGLCDLVGDRTADRYGKIQGTSMATPHAAGLVAIMKQAHRKVLGKVLTTTEVKEMVASFGQSKDNDAGWGPITWDMYVAWLETEYGVKKQEIMKL